MKQLLVRLLRQSPAMIVAMLALFVALTGTAVATTSALITGNQIKNSSITGADIKNKSLRPVDFRGSVRGPRGLRGLSGAPGAPGAAGVKGDKGDKGDRGDPGPFADVLPAGQAVRGDYAVSGNGTAAINPVLTGIDFGFQLSAALAATNVHFIALGSPVPAGCAGTAVSPDASPGHLCVFERAQVNRTANGVFNSAGAAGSDRTGAVVAIATAAAGVGYSAGTWAVRAPAAAAAVAPTGRSGTFGK